jgi:ABC-type Mn2+/Zn2+ transport system ATPase subunit
LILDEPFTGLDKDGSRVLMELLAEVKLQGSMVLITSHDPGATHSVTDGYMRLFRAALSEVVLVKGRSWQELEPLVYEDQVQGAAAKTPSGEGGSGGNLG